jgi:hypothetical protein
MSYELLSAIAAIGTFVVIAASAIAALIQLGHLRSSNQLQAVTALARDMDAVVPHLGFVYNELATKMNDPAFREEIAQLVNPDAHPELSMALFFDRFGMLVRLRLMEERLIFEHGTGATAIIIGWHKLEDVIAIRRRHAPDAYRNFEYLAVRAQAWLARYPHGAFPATEPRLPISDRWAADEANAAANVSPD